MAARATARGAAVATDHDVFIVDERDAKVRDILVRSRYFFPRMTKVDRADAEKIRAVRKIHGDVVKRHAC